MVFDLSQSHYLLMASGLTASSLTVGYHDINRDSSADAVLFTEENPVLIEAFDDPISHTLVMIHGSFMIVAWVGAASIGIFSAKYMKIWTGRKLLGKDIWFAIHQVCMSLTWILVISAFTIIWVAVGEWRTSAHSVLGIIATALCFIQPFGAFFRPAPESASRPLFAFLHGSVGMLAHTIAGKYLIHQCF